MKISADKKKQILLDSFDLLKENYSENSSALLDIIEKMVKIDFDISVSMWKYLIEKNPDVLYSGYSFAFSIMYEMKKQIGIKRLANLVTSDDFLKKAIFQECGDLSYTPLEIVEYYIKSGNYNMADELLHLIKSNSHDKHSMYKVLDGVIPEKDSKLSEDAFDFLMGWIDTISNKEECAKLNLRMLDFMDEDDEDEDDE